MRWGRGLWYDYIMNKKTTLRFVCVVCGLFVLFSNFLCAAGAPEILPMRKQVQIENQWLTIRLKTVIPEVMRRDKTDMWIVACREYNEDPVYLTLMPALRLSARRTSILVFFDNGARIERLIISKRGIGRLYTSAWTASETDPWKCLAHVVAQRDPKRIGINQSDTFNLADGLSATLKQKLAAAVGPKYAQRLHSAENIAIGWLEKRIPQELEIYPQIVSIAHGIIEEAFSSKVITSGVTTTSDVTWWMRQKINALGLRSWFHPTVDFQRKGSKPKGFGSSGIIRRGDLLHCDIGITYLGLNTDTQEMAYVLKEGETDAPQGLKEAMKQGVQLQDIFTAEFKTGRTGNEILVAALSKARAAGLKGMIYTHPLGFHGHGAGPTIGLYDRQEGVPGRGDYPLYPDTCYAVELNVKTKIPEWDGQEVGIGLEQDGVFLKTGGPQDLEQVQVRYLDGRQTRLHLIK